MVCVLAFSLQTQAEKYGAYIGIASFLGLALLSILYFAQAREVRRLRDWAGRAPERDAELEARVSAGAARRTPAPAPARPAPAPATAAAAQDTQVVAPPRAVPAANGRPATPLPVPMGPRPAVAAERVAAAVGAARAADAGDVAVEEPELATATAVAEREAAPATAVPARDEGPEEDAGADAPPAVVPRATPRPAPSRPVAQPLRASTTRSATVPPRRPAVAGRAAPAAAPAPRRRGPGRAVLLGALAGIVVLAGIVFAVTQLGGNASSTVPNTTVPSPTSTPAAGQSSTAAAGPAKADTTVVILNGTTTDGLAGNEKAALERAGYKTDRLPTVTSSNQTVVRSTVYYASARRRQAMDVARTLHIDAVQTLDPDTQALAENSSDTPVKADVVVILGADRNP